MKSCQISTGPEGRGRCHGSYQCRYLGNHSSTQYLIFRTRRSAAGRQQKSFVMRRGFKCPFITTVQQLGAMIIKARGSSSAGSAANAIVDSVSSIINPTPAGDWHSMCLVSDGSYGVEAGLISSFPIRSNGQKLEIVQGIRINEFGRSKIESTVNELKEERSLVSELLPKS